MHVRSIPAREGFVKGRPCACTTRSGNKVLPGTINVGVNAGSHNLIYATLVA